MLIVILHTIYKKARLNVSTADGYARLKASTLDDFTADLWQHRERLPVYEDLELGASITGFPSVCDPLL
jgi:hypothetical protein